MLGRAGRRPESAGLCPCAPAVSEAGQFTVDARWPREGFFVRQAQHQSPDLLADRWVSCLGAMGSSSGDQTAAPGQRGGRGRRTGGSAVGGGAAGSGLNLSSPPMCDEFGRAHDVWMLLGAAAIRGVSNGLNCVTPTRSPIFFQEFALLRRGAPGRIRTCGTRLRKSCVPDTWACYQQLQFVKRRTTPILRNSSRLFRTTIRTTTQRFAHRRQ